MTWPRPVRCRANKAKVVIYTSRPGIIIGKRGAGIEDLKRKLQSKTDSEVFLNIQEVRKPDLDATLVAQNIASQLTRRVSFRRAMKRGVQNAMRMGALGIRVNVAGRLGGAEIARTEWYREGRVPLHTLRFQPSQVRTAHCAADDLHHALTARVEDARATQDVMSPHLTRLHRIC